MPGVITNNPHLGTKKPTINSRTGPLGSPSDKPFCDPGISKKTIYVLFSFITRIFICEIFQLYPDWNLSL